MKLEKYNNYNTLTSVAYYLEEIIHISKEEGFLECLFDDIVPPIKFCFYFENWTDEQIYNKFDQFIEDNNLDIYEESQSNYRKKNIEIKVNEIKVIVPRNKIIEYAELYDNIKKYNL